MEKVSMKRAFQTMIVVSLLCAMLFCACGHPATEYTELRDYETVWNITGQWLQATLSYEGVSPLFPQTLESLNVSEFYGYYRPLIPLGNAFQIYVVVSYDTQEDFEAELERIETVVPIEDTERFSYPVAITALGWQGCMEYALIDQENLMVRYIYLEFCKLDEINIPHKYLPVDFKDYCDLEDGTSFIVYENALTDEA